MSNVSSQQAAVQSNIKAMVNAKTHEEPVMIQTPTGLCAVFNTRFISAKLQGVISALLNAKFWADGDIIAGPHVMSIVLRADGHPMKSREKAVYGTAHKEVQGFAINLVKTFEDALEEVIGLEPTLSIRAHLWHEILTTIAHEMYHVSMVKNLEAAVDWTEDDIKAEEEAAKKWAREIILDLAKSGTDIEPPSMEEEPLFQLMLMGANLKRLADPKTTEAENAAWANQLKMLSNGWMWHDPANDYTVETFAEYITVEEAGEAPIESGKVKIINQDTSAESEPMTASMMDMVPTSAAQTHVENTFGRNATPSISQEEAVAMAFGQVEQPAVAAPSAEYVATSADEAEALEMYDEIDDYGPESYVDEPFDESPAAPSAPAAAGNLFGGPADEVVPEPAPAPEPEERQAYNPQTVAATAHAVFTRAFQHIMTKCVPVNGIFQNPAAVYEPISIADIPGHEIFIGCDTINTNGQFGFAHRPGFIKGTLYKNGQLPVYVLHMNVGGVRMKRKLLAQNAAKNSKPGEEARAGNHVGWVVDGDTGSWKLKYLNGKLIPLQ